MPYVTASIIVQLMTVVIPTLERLQKEGEAGYAKINQYTRYLTVVLAAAQATGYAFLFKRQKALPNVNAGRLVIIILTLTAGCALLMWLGEQITKRGIGNGISLLIFASILAYAPTRRSARGSTAARWSGCSSRSSRSRVVVAVVFVQEGQRRIPVQYARRQLGNRQTTGGIDLHAAAREHGRRHPGHLRGRDHGAAADGCAVRPELDAASSTATSSRRASSICSSRAC